MSKVLRPKSGYICLDTENKTLINTQPMEQISLHSYSKIHSSFNTICAQKPICKTTTEEKSSVGTHTYVVFIYRVQGVYMQPVKARLLSV